MDPKPQSLQTPHLCLQPFRAADEAAMAALLTNEEIAKTYMIPVFSSRQEVTALFERFRQLSLDETRVVYGIYLDEMLIGFANEVHREGNSMEVGYVIHPDYQNRGYATEALWALVMGIFSMGFDTVRAGAFEENRASLRVMEKCGMTPTGEIEEISYRGKQYRCICCAISMADTIAQIRAMEELFDQLRQTQTETWQEKRNRLIDYYEGGCWLRHYMLDEAGLLPEDLKRGVLSQDAVYNFLASLA